MYSLTALSGVKYLIDLTESSYLSGVLIFGITARITWKASKTHLRGPEALIRWTDGNLESDIRGRRTKNYIMLNFQTV